MNVWSPVDWQRIGRLVFAITNVNLTYNQIEAFIDSRYLWDETPETIAARINEEIFHERN